MEDGKALNTSGTFGLCNNCFSLCNPSDNKAEP